jgi:hypothetical protein
MFTKRYFFINFVFILFLKPFGVIEIYPGKKRAQRDKGIFPNILGKLTTIIVNRQNSLFNTGYV